MKGSGFGTVGNSVVDLLGALVFSFLLGSLNLLKSPIFNQIAGSTINAVILLFVIGLITKVD